MSTDMTHCKGNYCPLRDGCYRYWIHQHGKARLASYFAAEPYDKKTNECKYFIKNEKP